MLRSIDRSEYMLVTAPNTTREIPKKLEAGDELVCFANEIAEKVKVVLRESELILEFEGGRNMPLSMLRADHQVYISKYAEPKPHIDRDDKNNAYSIQGSSTGLEETSPEQAELEEFVHANFIGKIFTTDKITFYAAKSEEIAAELLIDQLLELLDALRINYFENDRTKFQIEKLINAEKLFDIFKSKACLVDPEMKTALKIMSDSLKEAELVCQISTIPTKQGHGRGHEFRIYVEFKI